MENTILRVSQRERVFVDKTTNSTGWYNIIATQVSSEFLFKNAFSSGTTNWEACSNPSFTGVQDRRYLQQAIHRLQPALFLAFYITSRSSYAITGAQLAEGGRGRSSVHIFENWKIALILWKMPWLCSSVG